MDDLIFGHRIHIVGTFLPMLCLKLGNSHIGDSISYGDVNWRLVKFFMTGSHENQHEHQS